MKTLAYPPSHPAHGQMMTKDTSARRWPSEEDISPAQAARRARLGWTGGDNGRPYFRSMATHPLERALDAAALGMYRQLRQQFVSAGLHASVNWDKKGNPSIPNTFQPLLLEVQLAGSGEWFDVPRPWTTKLCAEDLQDGGSVDMERIAGRFEAMAKQLRKQAREFRKLQKKKK